MIDFGPVPAGATLPITFASYGKTNGESITLSGLAVTDIEVYKGASMTQRASDNGYTLLDTDGIDIDGVTGIHGFSIDLSDNSDASFYSVGSYFTVVVSSVTVDSQTVSFRAATFRIVAAEAVAGKPKVDVDLIEGSDATNQIRDSIVDDATRIDASALNTATGTTIPTNLDATISSRQVSIWAAANSTVNLSGTTVKAVTDRVTANTDQLAGQTVTAAAGVTFPSSVASPTNITAAEGVVLAAQTHTGAVIPTVSTLTGHTPQTGDSYAIVSNVSYGNAAIAFVVTNVFARLENVPRENNTATFNSTALASIQAEVADAIAAAGLPTLAQIFAGGDVDGYTLEQTLKLMLSALAAKLSGAATTTNTFRAADDSKDRITATVDADGNRTAVVLDATG